jgi:hypothetical protein
MEQQGSGSAERGLATPEVAVKNEKAKKQNEAPSAKEMETPTDKELPEDQQAMQPDSN